MRKRDIARRIHQRTGLSEERAVKVLDRILQLLASILRNGKSITIQGFGKFTVRQKRPRALAVLHGRPLLAHGLDELDIFIARWRHVLRASTSCGVMVGWASQPECAHGS